jgi:hypothetical protein
VIDKVYSHAIRKSPRLRKLLAYRIYQFLANRYRTREWTFMNYGYVPADPVDDVPHLEKADELDRSSIALYNHVAGAVPLEGCDTLEVGCGRGGGSSFIARYLRPRTMTGVDFSMIDRPIRRQPFVAQMVLSVLFHLPEGKPTVVKRIQGNLQQRLGVERVLALGRGSRCRSQSAVSSIAGSV